MILAAARTSRTRITNTPRGRMASLGRSTHTHTLAHTAFHVHRPIHGWVSTLPTLSLRAHIHMLMYIQLVYGHLWRYRWQWLLTLILVLLLLKCLRERDAEGSWRQREPSLAAQPSLISSPQKNCYIGCFCLSILPSPYMYIARGISLRFLLKIIFYFYIQLPNDHTDRK